jgi:NAD+ kinase
LSDVVLVYQPYVPATLEAAERVATYLNGRRPLELLSAHDLSTPPKGVKLAVCFGGDGTALRTARWLSAEQAPVVPVRMGKLSFLGEVAPADLPAVLDPYVAGDYWIDQRAMLEVRFDGERWLALNDAVLARGQAARAVSIEVVVDGASMVTYLCDGVVVSTATGSTAYSLAAGGPVLAPDLRCMVVTPIVPHLTALRSLVLPETARVGLWNRGYASTLLTVDGQVDLTMEPGHGVEVGLAAETSRFARRGSRSDFYQGLAAKLSRG